MRVRRTTFPVVAALVMVAGSGLFVGTGPAQAPDRARDPAQARPAAEATLDFGLDLYGALKTRPENLLLSPYSIATALAMVRVGARGETATQMDEALHYGPDVTPATQGALCNALRPGRVRDGAGRDRKFVEAFSLDTANALWLQVELSVEKPFTATLARDFGAPAERIDFRRTQQARERINAWVAKQTRDRIQNIVPEGLPTPETRLALANALYFKAAWVKPFEKEQTHDGTFHTGPEATVTVPFMHREEPLAYAEDENVQVVELPYRGHETSMVIVLPRKRDGLGALEKNLSATTVRGWLDQLKPRAVALDLPRFRFTYFTQGLSTVLQKLGMKDAFTGRADFSGLTRAEPLFISEVLHKTFIAVDEAGTEAAAATVVMMLKGAPRANRARGLRGRPPVFLPDPTHEDRRRALCGLRTEPGLSREMVLERVCSIMVAFRSPHEKTGPRPEERTNEEVPP